MVLLSTSDEWQRQSALLLQARPTTTRITTKYNVPDLRSAKYQNAKKRRRLGDNEEKEAGVAPKVPRAFLTLKTYDPESGVILKFKTDRAAEVGRLIGGLGRLGRHMAALPAKDEEHDTVMDDVAETEAAGSSAKAAAKDVAGTPAPEAKQTPATNSGGNVGGAGGKKKKKGKK